MKLSFKNARELNQVIDDKLPEYRPPFQRDEFEIGGEHYEFFYRDVIACVKALYGDENFAPYLVFKPERHYADEDKTKQLYHDMYTGEWWWTTQVCYFTL